MQQIFIFLTKHHPGDQLVHFLWFLLWTLMIWMLLFIYLFCLIIRTLYFRNFLLKMHSKEYYFLQNELGKVFTYAILITLLMANIVSVCLNTWPWVVNIVAIPILQMRKLKQKLIDFLKFYCSQWSKWISNPVSLCPEYILYITLTISVTILISFAKISWKIQ